MNRSDTYRRIAALSRGSHQICMYALAYMLTDAPTERLEGLLEGLEEFSATPGPSDHLAAFRERFGRVPGGLS